MDITECKRQEINLAFPAEVSQELVVLPDIDKTMDSPGAKIGQPFGLSRCVFVEVDDAREVCWVSYGWGREGAVASPGKHRIVDFISRSLSIFKSPARINRGKGLPFPSIGLTSCGSSVLSSASAARLFALNDTLYK
ncbi:hypothetical protein [Spirosoma aerophilum]